MEVLEEEKVNQMYLALGFVLLMFSIGIIVFPEEFNIGSIIGIAVFLIIIGFCEGSPNHKENPQ